MRERTAYRLGICEIEPEESDPEDGRCQTPESDAGTEKNDEEWIPTRRQTPQRVPAQPGTGEQFIEHSKHNPITTKPASANHRPMPSRHYSYGKRETNEKNREHTKFSSRKSPPFRRIASSDPPFSKQKQDNPHYFEEVQSRQKLSKAQSYQEDDHPSQPRRMMRIKTRGFEENADYHHTHNQGPQRPSKSTNLNHENVHYREPHPSHPRPFNPPEFPNYDEYSYHINKRDRLRPIAQPKSPTYRAGYPVQNISPRENRGAFPKSPYCKERPHPMHNEMRQRPTYLYDCSGEHIEEGRRSNRNPRKNRPAEVLNNSLVNNLMLLDQAIRKLSMIVEAPWELHEVRESLLRQLQQTKRMNSPSFRPHREERDAPVFREMVEPGAPSSLNNDHNQSLFIPKQPNGKPRSLRSSARQPWETMLDDDVVSETHFAIQLSPRELEMMPFEEEPFEFLKQRSRFLRCKTLR